MIIPLFVLAVASFAVAEASSLLSAPIAGGLTRRDDINGSPGNVCYADMYNAIGNNWNHTYTPSEPQQIHISLTDDAKNARVQFATVGQIDQSILQYWPKKEGHHATKKATTIKGEVSNDSSFTFTPTL